MVTVGADPLGGDESSSNTSADLTASAAYRGVTSFRPAESGTHKVFLIHTTTRRLVSGVHRVEVQVGELPDPSAKNMTVSVLMVIHVCIWCCRCVEIAYHL